MALTSAECERLEAILQGLEPCTKDMNERAQGFVREQIDRYEQYKSRMFLSPKQLSWLESLYTEHVGELPAGGKSSKVDDERRDVLGEGADYPDMDDEIPF